MRYEHSIGASAHVSSRAAIACLVKELREALSGKPELQQGEMLGGNPQPSAHIKAQNVENRNP